MTDRPIAVDLFVSAGLLCHQTGVLPDALAELIIRADIVAGDLLAEAMQLEWTPQASDDKRDPHPVPRPKPQDPPPKDPKS